VFATLTIHVAFGDESVREPIMMYNTWVAEPMFKILVEFKESLRKYPPIKAGTPDPYIPPK
jgi:hypothetical protein